MSYIIKDVYGESSFFSCAFSLSSFGFYFSARSLFFTLKVISQNYKGHFLFLFLLVCQNFSSLFLFSRKYRSGPFCFYFHTSSVYEKYKKRQ